jgi:hypothetical protein
LELLDAARLAAKAMLGEHIKMVDQHLDRWLGGTEHFLKA